MHKLFYVLAIIYSAYCAADTTSVNDKISIEKILASIPNKDKTMPYENLSERMQNINLSVNHVIFGKMQKSEIKISSGLYKNGDFLYQFFTNEPSSSLKSICSILNTFTFIKRGNTWRPDSKTANFLVAGKCSLPN